MKPLLSILLCCGPLLADLSQVRAEPNLEKRATLALDYAERALKDSRRVYADGDAQQSEGLLDQVADAVELAETSLKDTHKDPIKSPRHFKNAEIKTRGLLRTIEAFTRDMNAADRSMTDKTRERVQEVHDRLLQNIMTGKKK